MSDVSPLPEKTPAIHDMGGLSRFRCSPVERDEAPPDAFGKRVDALRQVLAAKKMMTVDELRRGIESIPEDEYFALTYYERWMTSIWWAIQCVTNASRLNVRGTPSTSASMFAPNVSCSCVWRYNCESTTRGWASRLSTTTSR